MWLQPSGTKTKTKTTTTTPKSRLRPDFGPQLHTTEEFLERVHRESQSQSQSRDNLKEPTMEFYDGDLKDIWDSDLDPVSLQVTLENMYPLLGVGYYRTDQQNHPLILESFYYSRAWVIWTSHSICES